MVSTEYVAYLRFSTYGNVLCCSSLLSSLVVRLSLMVICFVVFYLHLVITSNDNDNQSPAIDKINSLLFSQFY